jgi:hypothetical protein
LQIKTKIVSSNTADSKPVKQDVNGTVILPPLGPLVPQSSAKDQFYFTVYHTTLNSNCEAHTASKNLKINVEDRVKSQN